MFNRCESCHCYFVLVILKNDPVTLSVFGVLKQHQNQDPKKGLMDGQQSPKLKRIKLFQCIFNDRPNLNIITNPLKNASPI